MYSERLEESRNDLVSNWRDHMVAYAAAGSFIATAIGVRKNIGFFRALSLLSKFRVESTQKSIRVTEMKILEHAVNNCTNKASYVVVQGPKGVGKSCMIDTWFSNSKGVVKCDITPGTLEKEVLNSCYEAINGGASKTVADTEPNMLRVLKWYNWITFGSYPTIIVGVSERPPDTKPAQLTGAVRKLAELGLSCGGCISKFIAPWFTDY